MLFLLIFIFGRSSGEAKAGSQDVKRINRYLASTPMKGTGRILDAQGRRHNISPYFIVAVAGKESSYGAAACGNNRKNVWGLGACGRAWNPPYFENWIEAINYFVRFINQRWPGAYNPFQFYGYCNGCETEWANGIIRHLNAMNAPMGVKYEKRGGS